MKESDAVQVYLCSNCLLADGEPGACLRCGRARLTCRPGDPDDPCRRPMMDGGGRVRSRAPMWWLMHTVSPLMERMDLVPRGR